MWCYMYEVQYQNYITMTEYRHIAAVSPTDGPDYYTTMSNILCTETLEVVRPVL